MSCIPQRLPITTKFDGRFPNLIDTIFLFKVNKGIPKHTVATQHENSGEVGILI
jgi:hypothetical protein